MGPFNRIALRQPSRCQQAIPVANYGHLSCIHLASGEFVKPRLRLTASARGDAILYDIQWRQAETGGVARSCSLYLAPQWGRDLTRDLTQRTIRLLLKRRFRLIRVQH